MSFKNDRIENEKDDPVEGSALNVINVPIALLSFIIGFGACYLILNTKNTSMLEGDSRTIEMTSSQEKSPEIHSEKIPASPENLESLITAGQKVYAKSCQACHQADGTGIPGAFPPLAGSEWVTGPAKRAIAIVLHGIEGEITVKGESYRNAMPPQTQLSSEDMASVLTYIRNSFDNTASLVTTELVNEVKELTKTRTEAWQGEKELNSQNWD